MMMILIIYMTVPSIVYYLLLCIKYFYSEEGLCMFFRCQIWQLIEHFFRIFGIWTHFHTGRLPRDRWSMTIEMSWKPHISVCGGITFMASDDVNPGTGCIVNLIRSVIKSN